MLLHSCVVSGLAIAVLGTGCATSTVTPDSQSGNADAASPEQAADAAPRADARPQDAIDAGPSASVDANTANIIEPLLNEVLLDQEGSDSDEFVEIKGTPSTDYSAYTVIQIDGDASTQPSGTNPGEILTSHPVGTTNASGYFRLDVPANSFQNGTQTLLLVRGFTGAATDVDADDDGVIDTTPWAELIDGVAIFDGRPATGNIDKTYAGGAVLNKQFDTNDQPIAFGAASRIPDGSDTDSASDWVSNTPVFSNATFSGGQALNTPGAVNAMP